MLRSLQRFLTAIATVLAVSAISALPALPQASTIQRATSSQPSLVGYFPQWGLYNQPRYLVKNLITGSAPLVDQINYAQGFVTNGHCSIADPNADLNYTFSSAESVDGTADTPTQPFRGYLHQLQELKRRYPKIRILLSLEGRASDFAFDAQPENREAFINSCIDTFIKGNFAPGISVPGLIDGLDIDWEYPHQPDAANYLALLTELRAKMNALRPGLLLTVAVGPSPHMYQGSDLAAVARLVDRVGLMTYDFNGPWSETTGFIAPLTTKPGYDGNTVAHSVDAWLNAGVPAEKLLMGVPFYGYGWHQVLETDNGLSQEGLPIRGDRPYSYISTLIPQSTVYRDPTSQTPWLFDGDIFWTYDDPVSVDRKAAYAVDHHLGGLMIWELSEDTLAADLLHAAWHSLHYPATIPLQQLNPPAPSTP